MRQVYQEQLDLSQLNEFDDLAAFQQRLDLIIEYAPDQEQKRIYVMNQLHRIRTKAPSIIGYLLTKQEEIIRRNYENWKRMRKEGDVPPPASLYEWFKRKEGELAFSYSTARMYIQLYQDTDPQIMDSLGPKKLSIIRQLPNEHREKLQRKAIENSWSASKLETEVKRILERYTAEVVPRSHRKEVVFNVTQTGSTVVIDFSRARNAEILASAFVTWLGTMESSLRRYLIKALTE